MRWPTDHYTNHARTVDAVPGALPDRAESIGHAGAMSDMIGDGIPLQASLHFDADRALVAVSGEIDCYSGPMLAELLDATADGRVPHVEVDMALVGFVDIAGLRMLDRAHHIGAQRGVVLTLRRPTPGLLWLLQITGTTTLLLGDMATADKVRDTAAVAGPQPRLSRRIGAGDIMVTDASDATGTRGQQADERDRQPTTCNVVTQSEAGSWTNSLSGFWNNSGGGPATTWPISESETSSDENRIAEETTSGPRENLQPGDSPQCLFCVGAPESGEGLR